MLLATLLLVIVTYLLYDATRALRKSADIQITATLTQAFQDEWHDSQSRLMRQCLYDDEFLLYYGDVIKSLYGGDVTLLDIERLLLPPKSSMNCFKQFREKLTEFVFLHPATRTELFTGYDALEQTLLIFDRLALLRNEGQAINTIKQYKPPIRGLKDILQSLIAIKIAFSSLEQKNYKKDYMLLLYKLDLHNESLFDLCKKGLEERGELSAKEFAKENKIKDRYF